MDVEGWMDDMCRWREKRCTGSEMICVKVDGWYS